MSLAEETARVAGGGKNTLKTMLQKLGVGVGSERIDQYPTLANQISGKLHPDNLISSATASSLGLAGTATPNEAFAKIKALIDAANANAAARCKITSGSYVGTGTYGQASPTSINTGNTSKFLIVTIDSPLFYAANNSLSWFFWMPGITLVKVYGNSDREGTIVSQSQSTVSWYHPTSADGQLNVSGYTYRWISFG